MKPPCDRAAWWKQNRHTWWAMAPKRQTSCCSLHACHTFFVRIKIYCQAHHGPRTGVGRVYKDVVYRASPWLFKLARARPNKSRGIRHPAGAARAIMRAPPLARITVPSQAPMPPPRAAWLFGLGLQLLSTACSFRGAQAVQFSSAHDMRQKMESEARITRPCTQLDFPFGASGAVP